MKSFFISVLTLSVSLMAQADMVVLEERINTREGMPQWNNQLVEKVLTQSDLKKTGLIECAEVNELPGAYFCAATKKSMMNKALSRASIFSEGTTGVNKGNVIGTDSKSYLDIVAQASGHDIPSSELIGFWAKLEQTCQAGGACPIPEEKEFFDKIVSPISQIQHQFVIISYSLDSDWYQTVTHELMHAQYFLNPVFQKTVDTFWDHEVTPDDRKKIKQVLSQGYNQNDEFVMKNEFQAYLLDSKGPFGWLKDFSVKYRLKLVQKLTEAGTPPLEVRN